MSTVPPPPGGYPPYDPKTQWRIYREQQKAARRAQKNAWRAQRWAWKANYAGVYGPRVPSLVGPLILVVVGIIWLLIYSGHLPAQQFFTWYAHWWPVLLIGAGLALLAEWALDMRRQTPVRRGGGFAGVLIFLAILGLIAAGVNHFSNNFGPWTWGGDNEDLFNMFGLPQHDADQEAISETVPGNATIDIENPRGDVSVTTGAGTTLDVQAHEIAFAESNSTAKKIFDAEKVGVKVSGTAVLVQSNGHEHGRVNLNVTVPAGARVTVNAEHGDVTADGINAGMNLTVPHGDVRLNSIAGAVLAHLGKGDLVAHNMQGDITADGSCGDVTLSDVKGGFSASCEYFNDMHIEHVTGPVRLRTAKTDVQIAELPGDLNLSDDALNVTQAKGAAHVVTHSRDIDLSEIYGDTYVENSDGTISVSPAGAYGVEVHNKKGDVEISLPPNASGTVSGHARNGDIVTDFPLSVSGDEDKTVSGRIGAGAAKIVLTADNGDVRIKKASMVPTPPAPPAPPVPPTSLAPPAPPNAPHLKGRATQQVTQ